MNKCLVTKLQASCTAMENPKYLGKAELVVSATDAINVPFIYQSGKITFEIIEGDSSAFTIHRGAEEYIKQINSTTWVIEKDDDGTIYDSGNSSSYNPLKFSKAGEYRIRFDKYTVAPYSNSLQSRVLLDINDMQYRQDGVRQKFNFYGANSFNGEIDKLCDFTNSDTNAFSINNQYQQGVTTGDLIDVLSRLNKLEMIRLSFCDKMTGNIENFNAYTNKSNLKIISFRNFGGELTGNIVNAFKYCTSLTELDIENCSLITGSIEELAQAQVNNGRTSGTLMIKGNAGNVVPNPTTRGKTITFTSDGYTIS